MTAATSWWCPRCHESTDVPPGKSRATGEHDIEVCGSCCSDEAWMDAAGRPLQAFAQWPVVRLYRADGTW